MSAGWVAGSVRARALARRGIGVDGARRLAACGSLMQALSLFAATPYRIGPGRAGWPGAGTGEAGGEQEALATAQHAIAEALLWDLRVLAGWLPQGGAQLMRTLAGWFEISNVSERLSDLSGRPSGPEFRLGALATAWPRFRRCSSLADLRAAAATSVWKDPGGDTARALAIGLRTRWAERVARLGEPARMLAAAAIVLLLAGERFGAASGRPDTAPENPVLRQVAASLLGQAAADAGTYGELAGRLPRRLSWVLEPASAPADLWRAEAGWWARTEQEGRGLLTGPGFDQWPVIGAVAVLAADARRTGAALEVAARGGGPIEVFDAVA